MKKRNYIQARNLLKEAKVKIKNFDAVIGRTKNDYDALRQTGILCNAFSLKEPLKNRKIFNFLKLRLLV